jgi:hypothetical protein
MVAAAAVRTTINEDCYPGAANIDLLKSVAVGVRVKDEASGILAEKDDLRWRSGMKPTPADIDAVGQPPVRRHCVHRFCRAVRRRDISMIPHDVVGPRPGTIGRDLQAPARRRKPARVDLAVVSVEVANIGTIRCVEGNSNRVGAGVEVEAPVAYEIDAGADAAGSTICENRNAVELTAELREISS